MSGAAFVHVMIVLFGTAGALVALTATMFMFVRAFAGPGLRR